MLRRAQYWYATARVGAPGASNKVKTDKRLEEIARIEGETITAAAPIATARFTTRFNKWFPLLLSNNELTGWETGDCRFTYAGGVIEPQEDFMFCPIVARDVAIQARMKRSSGAPVYLVVRNSDAGCYAAMLEGRTVRIVTLKLTPGQNKNVPLRQRQKQDVLSEFTFPKEELNVIFEFKLAVTGNVLAASLGGIQVLQAKDSTFTEGTVGLGARNNARVQVDTVELFLPNRASLVADRRTVPPPAKDAVPNDFKFPSIKPAISAGN